MMVACVSDFWVMYVPRWRTSGSSVSGRMEGADFFRVNLISSTCGLFLWNFHMNSLNLVVRVVCGVFMIFMWHLYGFLPSFVVMNRFPKNSK